jgi:hypothetical protein
MCINELKKILTIKQKEKRKWKRANSQKTIRVITGKTMNKSSHGPFCRDPNRTAD